MKTMANIKRCNIGAAEQHNTRDKNYIDRVNASPKKRYSIFDDRTASNISWVNPDYSGKSLQEIFENQKKLYTAKTGQKPQLKDRIRVNKKTGKEYTVSGWSPIREAVVLVKDDTTIEDFEPFIAWLQEKGVKVIRIDIHRDEGHTDVETGERKYNLHAHLILDYQNPETGKTAKLSDDDMPEMQTKIAEALGMERGVSKDLTGAEHLTPDDFRAKKAAEKAAELEAKVAKLEAENERIINNGQALETMLTDTLRNLCTTLAGTAKGLLWHFDKLVGVGEKVTKSDTAQAEELRTIVETPLPEGARGLQERQAALQKGIVAVTKIVTKLTKSLKSLTDRWGLMPWAKSKYKRTLEERTEQAEMRVTEMKKHIGIQHQELVRALEEHSRSVRKRFSDQDLLKILREQMDADKDYPHKTMYDDAVEHIGYETVAVEIEGVRYRLEGSAERLSLIPLAIISHKARLYLAEHPELELTDTQNTELRIGNNVHIDGGWLGWRADGTFAVCEKSNDEVYREARSTRCAEMETQTREMSESKSRENDRNWRQNQTI